MATEPALYIVVPRWDEFQHRDMARTTIPPWIKNYTRLLSDDDYLSLTASQRGILHGLWLMFATHRRSLNEARAKRHLCTNKAELRHWTTNLSAIVDAGFIALSASKPAGKVAGLEVEVEVEVEREIEEKEQDLAAAAAANGALGEREDEPLSVGTTVPSRSPSAPSTDPMEAGGALAIRKANPCWDFLVAIKGEPLPKQRSGYGRVAADLRTLLEREGVSEDWWAATLRDRLGALALAWGGEKATPRALVEHWQLAANLLAGTVTARSHNGVKSGDDILREAESMARGAI